MHVGKLTVTRGHWLQFLVNMNKVSLNICMQDFVDTDFQINWGNK